MINASASYRRGDCGSLRIPVVMPLVDVTVDPRGCLNVRLDREPYPVDGALHRGDLQRILDEISADLGTPVRVEVHEQDGTMYTDFATPPTTSRPLEAQNVWSLSTAPAGIGEVGGEGFAPNENVAVAVVVAHQVADTDGRARLRLPPALLATHPGVVVLMGKTSGTVTIDGGAA